MTGRVAVSAEMLNAVVVYTGSFATDRQKLGNQERQSNSHNVHVVFKISAFAEAERVMILDRE
jgi:hypothetical protein